jgi:hypothetical protein
LSSVFSEKIISGNKNNQAGFFRSPYLSLNAGLYSCIPLSSAFGGVVSPPAAGGGAGGGAAGGVCFSLAAMPSITSSKIPAIIPPPNLYGFVKFHYFLLLP